MRTADDAMVTYEPMEVRRIADGSGSHIEPPLEQSWSDLEKLRWHAGVVLADTGVRVGVTTNSASHKNWRGDWVIDRDMYSLNVGRASYSAYRYDDAWTFIIGVSAGAEALR